MQVRGAPTAEELAAVLAMLPREPQQAPSGYEQWRATRLAALRRATGDGAERP